MKEVVIEDVVYRGKGLARLDGKVVFVRDTIPGERVRVRIVRERKRHAEAEPVEFVGCSPHRVEPACALSARCPGCCYQHMDYSEEVRLKAGQLADFMEHRAGMKPEIWLAPVPAPRPLEYRNKLTLHAGRRPGPVLGYYGFDNTEILDVERCPLAVPPLNTLLAKLRSDRTFMDRLSSGDSVTLRYTARNGAVSWVGSSGSCDVLTERTGIGEIDVPVGSFFQVNMDVANMLLRQVVDILVELKPAKVIDAYCGSGVFAIAAAQAGTKQVFGSDRDKLAVQAARRNAARLKVGNARFLETTAFEALRELLDLRDSGRIVLILDPPRTGLESRVADIIGEMRPEHVVYLSCAADTLARDLVKLGKSGYRLVKAGVVDMFPRTAYFESLSVLARPGR